MDSDEPYSADALQPIFSSGKMAMSVLTSWVASRYKGTFSIEDRVAKHWYERSFLFGGICMADDWFGAEIGLSLLRVARRM